MHIEITYESIQDLVQVFYDRVRDDEILSPVFNKALGDDWAPHQAKLVEFWSTIVPGTNSFKGNVYPTHMAKLVEFWSAVVLGSNSFKGNVYGTHMALTGIEPAHFERWLRLFEQTARELFDQQSAEQFLKTARRGASSLQIGFFGDVAVSR
jgi:hemoglobin